VVRAPVERTSNPVREVGKDHTRELPSGGKGDEISLEEGELYLFGQSSANENASHPSQDHIRSLTGGITPLCQLNRAALGFFVHLTNEGEKFPPSMRSRIALF
jgi:hypothetical protein